MTPSHRTLRRVERRREAAAAAVNAYKRALVEAVDDGHSYRIVAQSAGLSAARVHEIVALERADQIRRAREGS